MLGNGEKLRDGRLLEEGASLAEKEQVVQARCFHLLAVLNINVQMPV